MNHSTAVPTRGQAWETHLHAINDGRPGEVRPAIASLVADNDNRAQILADLLELVHRLSDVLYGAIPTGSEIAKYDGIAKAATAQQAAIQALLGIVGPRTLLDESRFIQAVDKSGMLQRLGRWPDHVATMRTEASQTLANFRDKYGTIRPDKIQVFGLGGSAAPHDIAAEVLRNSRKSRVRVDVVHADEPNPDYTDENTLVVFASFSGNTEETLNCYAKVRAKAGAVLALSQGGKLRAWAHRDGVPFMQLPEDPQDPAYVLQPRESVCLQLTGLLCFLAGLGLPAGSAGSLAPEDLDLDGAIAQLCRWRARFEPSTPFDKNDPKQLALFLLYGVANAADTQVGLDNLWHKRTPFILADRNNAALAHEVRTQLHERSKVNGACYEAPEFLHNLVESVRSTSRSSQAGLDEDRWVYYFIRSIDEQPRIATRLDKTIEHVFRDKASFAVLTAEGSTPFHRALFATYFNAYMSTYLAVLNAADPLPVPTMSWLKNVMSGIPRSVDATGSGPDTGLQEKEVERRQSSLEMSPPRPSENRRLGK